MGTDPAGSGSGASGESVFHSRSGCWRPFLSDVFVGQTFLSVRRREFGDYVVAGKPLLFGTSLTKLSVRRNPLRSFRLCPDAQLAPDIAKQLSLTPNDLFVCLDAALDDTLAANRALQCRLRTV